MNFFRTLFQRDNRKAEEPSKSISIADIYNDTGVSGVYDGQLSVSVMGASLAYMYVPEVMSAIDIISESASVVPMVIRDAKGNEIARSDKNPDDSRLIRAIQNSSRIYGVPLIELMCKSDLLWGMTFVEPLRDSFNWLNTSFMQIDAPSQKLLGYWYRDGTRQIPYNPDDLIYIRQFHPRDNIYGWSKTFNIMSKANMTLDFDRFTISYYRNGGIPGMMVQFKEKGNLSDAEALATMWRKTFRGVDNFFKTHVSHIPLDITALDPIDIGKPLKVANKSGLDILKVYHVPPELVGDTSSNAYQFSAEKKNTFMQTVVQPATIDIEQAFNRSEIIRHYEPEGYTFHLDYSEFQNITENDKARQQMARENFQAGGMEYNDYLTTIGQKPNSLFAGMYYVPGINAPMPANEIANLWRYQILVAPSVFNSSEVTGTPLPQPVNPDEVILTGNIENPDVEQLAPPNGKHQHDVIDHAIANTTNEQWSKAKARKELVSWLRRYRIGQAKNIKPEHMRGDFADAIQDAIDKKADVEGAFDKAFDFLNSSINLLEATFTTILSGSYHEPLKNIHAILNSETGILEYTDIGYRFDKASVFKSVQAIRLDFEDRFEAVLADIRLGNVSDRRRAGSILRQIGTIFINRGFRQGLEDGGVMDDPGDEDKAEIKTLVSIMSGHISNLTKVLIKEDGITDAQAAGKLGQWWNKSILPAYYAGFNSAARNQMMEFAGRDGKNSCVTCQRLNGQRHRMKDWTRKKLRPQVDTQNYICGGWECNHRLVPVAAKARGPF